MRLPLTVRTAMPSRVAMTRRVVLWAKMTGQVDGGSRGPTGSNAALLRERGATSPPRSGRLTLKQRQARVPRQRRSAPLGPTANGVSSASGHAGASQPSSWRPRMTGVGGQVPCAERVRSGVARREGRRPKAPHRHTGRRRGVRWVPMTTSRASRLGSLLLALAVTSCRCTDDPTPAPPPPAPPAPSRAEVHGLRATSSGAVVTGRLEVTYVLEWTAPPTFSRQPGGAVQLTNLWLLQPIEPATVNFWDGVGALVGETTQRIGLPTGFREGSTPRHEAHISLVAPAGAKSLSVSLGRSGLESDRSVIQ
jgi:hypothetical protein